MMMYSKSKWESVLTAGDIYSAKRGVTMVGKIMVLYTEGFDARPENRNEGDNAAHFDQPSDGL